MRVVIACLLAILTLSVMLAIALSFVTAIAAMIVYPGYFLIGFSVLILFGTALFFYEELP